MEQDYNLKKWSKGCPNTGVNCRRSSCGIEYVFIPAALGDDQEGSPVAPKNGSYNNAIVYYEATGNVYLYSSDGVPTRVEKNLDSIIAELQRELNDVEEALSEETSAREAADAAIEQEIEDLRNEPDVVDIVGTYADLQAYNTSDLGDKDTIRVLVDETHDDESTYYRWNKTPQTWTYIGAIDGYYTKDQTDTLLEGKQDVLTAGTNVQISSQNVISATDTTYSDFTGTDGTAAGTSGLVPAPATTDAGKFLKADGTWGTVQAGGGATIFYTDGGLMGWGEDIEGPLFYKDSSYQTPATASEMYAACMTGPVYICSNQSDDLFYTEIVAMSNYSTNYNFSLANIEHGLGYDCTIASYISSGTEYYNFYYNEPSSINVVQSTGSSTTNVMSQNAATNMVFPNNDTQRVQIGAGASTVAYTQGVAIGRNAHAQSTTTVAIGSGATAEDVSGVAIGNLSDAAEPNSVALGGSAVASRRGEVNVGTGSYNYGYNSTSYRVIGGVHDGQTAHDVATVGQLNGRVLTSAGAPTTSTVGTVGQLYEDTTNGKLYICTDATNPYVWEEVGSGGGGGGETMLVTLTKTTIGQYSNVWVWSSDYTFAQLTANPDAIRVFVNDWCYASEGNIKPTDTKVRTSEQSTEIYLVRDLAGVEMSFILRQPQEIEGQTVNPAIFDVTNFVDKNKTDLLILPTLTLADNATYIPDGTTITLQTLSSDKEMYSVNGNSDCYPHERIINGNFMILPVKRKVGSGASSWVEEECLVMSASRRGTSNVSDSYIYKTFMFNGEYYKMTLTNSSYPDEVYTITKMPGGH